MCVATETFILYFTLIFRSEFATLGIYGFIFSLFFYANLALTFNLQSIRWSESWCLRIYVKFCPSGELGRRRRIIESISSTMCEIRACQLVRRPFQYILSKYIFCDNLGSLMILHWRLDQCLVLQLNVVY